MTVFQQVTRDLPPSFSLRLAGLLCVCVPQSGCGGDQIERAVPPLDLSGVLCEQLTDHAASYGRVGGIVRLSDGRVAITDLDRMRLVILSANGAELGALGRRGSGPGEFQALTRVWSDGRDTIVVWDERARRLSIMHADLGFTRGWSPGASEDSAGLVPMERFPNGGFLWGEFGVEGLTAKRQVSRPRIRLYAGNPGSIVPLGFSLNGPEVLRGGREPTLGVGFGHTSLLTVVGNTIVVHDNATAVISRYNDRGELLGRLPVPGDRETHVVGRADARRIRRERAARARQVLERTPQAASLIQSYLRGLKDAPVARYMPLNGDLLSDSRGLLWIGEYVPPYDQEARTRHWWVVGSDGAVRHELSLPALARIGAISEEGFWVAAEDAEDGSTLVERYCIGVGGASCGPCRTTRPRSG